MDFDFDNHWYLISYCINKNDKHEKESEYYGVIVNCTGPFCR